MTIYVKCLYGTIDVVTLVSDLLVYELFLSTICVNFKVIFSIYELVCV